MKDETRTRLTEMTGFPMGGFGFPKTRLGIGTYNRERKATILRQFAADKDSVWGGGLRVPIGNRIAHAAEALTWGATNTDKPGGDVMELADCIPFTYESYGSFTTDGKKYEARGKPPRPIDAFTSAEKQPVELCSLFSDGDMPRSDLKWLQFPNKSTKRNPRCSLCTSLSLSGEP